VRAHAGRHETLEHACCVLPGALLHAPVQGS
jgi:hypothetical protein